MGGAEAAQKFLGRYQILSLLGRGGMAEVYRAKVLKGPWAGREVAIKRLRPALAADPESVAAFAAEGELTRQLDHPNIVRVLEVGVHEANYVIVMDLVDGRDLAQVIRRCKRGGIPLPMDFVLFLARTLCDALAHAHEANDASGNPLEIVHCDVSPSNLFVSRTGEIALGDFGVARARMHPGSDGAFHGKVYYVSPEVLGGEITREADLWAATATLYELITLQRPFAGEHPNEVFRAVREGRYEPASQLRADVPEAVEQIIARGFSPKREDRFSSARELGDALAPLYDERIGNPMAIAAVVRGLFGATASAQGTLGTGGKSA